MTHMDAQNRIKICTRQLTLSIYRSGSVDRVWSPTVSEDGKTSPYMESDSQNFRPITSGYGSYSRKPSYTSEPQSPQSPQPIYQNNSNPRPNNGHSYGNGTGAAPYGNSNGNGSPQYGNGTGHAQYNNPAMLYGHNGSNGERALPSKMGGLSISASQSPEPPTQSPVGRNGFNPQSDVYKMLQDYEEPVSEPKQSGSFKYLQGILEAEDGGLSPTERLRNLKSPVRSPIPKLGSPIPSPMSGLQKLPQCTRCCNGIVGTIVKARDKLYHPECFMCDDCGLNLKQRGYFFIEDNLYCETHAKARVQPPEGYDVVAVYPNSKVELV
ncbi:PDZ and LIM domain protein 4 isoform X2 [Gouania willdenowi]|nr:PDZ and LIM domain protein 4 isoform X2 [Gouania willdenowi]